MDRTRSDREAVRAPSGRRVKVWGFRLVAMTAVPALFFGLLELGLNLFGYGYPTGFFVRTEGGDGYTTNPKFGWQFFPREITRLPDACELPAVKADDAYRIFVLGGSAAMGTPDPAFGVARILEAMLRERYAGVRFEVVNAAMTAVNSHVVLRIAEDCAEVGGDLFVVYMGNNEVVGPYGAGTVFKGHSPSLAAIRAGIYLRSTKTGQLVEGLMRKLTGGDAAPADWKGMAMFLDHRVPADDPRMDAVYGHFRRNLSDICDIVHRTGARGIVCTVATNLKDNAPFASMHRADLAEADSVRWQGIYDAGIALEKAGRIVRAVERFEEAAGIDGDFADLHFRLGRCYLTLGAPGRARGHFVRARDLDALRFRADTEINRIIREVAGGRAGRGIRLLDVARVVAQNDRTPHGIPGEEMFYEHAHLTFDGNYAFAQALFREVTDLLPEWIRERAPGPVLPPSQARCAELLQLTGWDRFRMYGTISVTMDSPPFTHQLDYEERRARRLQRLERLGSVGPSPTFHIEAYRRAIKIRPDNVDARIGLAEALRNRGDSTGAAEQYRRVLEIDPEHPVARRGLGLLKED